MDSATLIALINALAGYAWPLVALIAVILFRGELRDFLGRVRRGKIFGQELELDSAAEVLRSAAKSEAAGANPPEETPEDRAAVLETTAAVLEARTDQERAARLQDLRKTVLSPVQRARRATEWVMSLERNRGREPVEIDGPVGDIKSGERIIEIKVVRTRGIPFVRLTNAFVEAARNLENMYLYLVTIDNDDDISTWQVRVVGRQALLSVIEQGRSYYEVSARALAAASVPLEET